MLVTTLTSYLHHLVVGSFILFVYLTWSPFESIDVPSVPPLLSVRVSLSFRQDDEQVSKDIDEVNEEHHGMRDVVLFAHPSLLDNECSVITNEATEDKEPSIQVEVKQDLTSEEEVEEGGQHHDGQTRHQSASQVEVLPMVSEEGRDCEATKDYAGGDQGLQDQIRVQDDGKVQEGSHRQSRTGCEPEQVSQSSRPVLDGVRGRPDGKSEPEQTEG